MDDKHLLCQIQQGRTLESEDTFWLITVGRAVKNIHVQTSISSLLFNTTPACETELQHRQNRCIM